MTIWMILNPINPNGAPTRGDLNHSQIFSRSKVELLLEKDSFFPFNPNGVWPEDSFKPY